MYNIQPLDDTEPWYTKEAQERWDKSVINDLWWSFEEKIGHPDVEGMSGLPEAHHTSLRNWKLERNIH